MTTQKLNRRPFRAFRAGSVLLPLTCMLGMGPAVLAAPPSPASATSGTTDPDAPLRPKLSPAELDRLALTLETQAQQVTQELNDGRTRLGLGADDELRLTRAQLDPYGTAHFRFRQYHQGLRVLGVGLIAHRDAASATNTPYLAPGLSMDITPAIPEAQARTIAEQAFGAAAGTTLTTLLELAIEPIEVIRFEPDPATGEINNSNQMFRDVVGYRLVYVAQVSPEEPDAPEPPPEAAPTGEPPAPTPSRAGDAYSLDDTEPRSDSGPVVSKSPELAQEPLRLLIDATTGRIVDQRKDLSNAGQPVTSLGHSLIHDDVELSTNYDSGLVRYQLYDPYRSINSVRDLRNGTSGKTKNSFLYWSPDNEFGDGQQFEDGDNTSSARGETPAVDVAYGLERTWDMLRKVFGRKGVDGKNSPVNARVHYGHTYNDAHWSYFWKAPFFGDNIYKPDPKENPPPRTQLDTVGHELGHGLWQSELGASHRALTVGINEGNGDVMGSLVLFYTLGDQGLGSHIPDTHAGWNWLPRMVNPPGYPEEDDQKNVHYGLRYFTSYIATEPVHVIGTLYGHAFVFLAHGSASNTNSPLYSKYLPNGMAGIGADRAGELWYLVATAYLPEEPDFNQLRAAYLAAASQIYGKGSRVHNAVKDAFGAVGVGDLAVDSTAPQILDTHLATVDEGDGTAFVVASVDDDTGVLRTEFKVGPSQRNSGFRPFEAYLDLSSLALGPHPVSVTAVDRTLKTTSTNLPLTLVGANQLLTNGNFEAGTVGWTPSAGVIGTWDGKRAQPFMGARNAVFSASGSLSQNATIPADATTAPLSFRVRVESNPTDAALLSVSVKDLNTGVETLLASYARDDVKYFTAGRHYRRAQFDLASFRGHTLQLRFVSNAATGTNNFAVDNVSLTYTAPIQVSPPNLVLHEDEQTLRFEFGGIGGYAPERIKRVEYVVGGAVKGVGTAPPTAPVLVSIKDWPTGSASVVARVYDFAGALVGQSASVPLTLKGAKQALSNGDFEQGNMSWTLSGSVGVATDGEGVYFAFLGQRYARLGGQGVQHDSSISQIIGLPSDILSAHLSYRLAIKTDEDNAGGTDKLQIEVQDLSGGTWEVLEVVDANTNISGGETFKGYQRRTVDLTAYRGKTVRLRFRVRENTGLQTTYRVDNASVSYTPLVIGI